MRKPKDLGPHENQLSSTGDMPVLRVMKLPDLDAVMEIESSSFLTPWSRAYFSQEISRNPLASCFVLDLNGKIAGYCVVWAVRKELHINNFAIAPDCRNRGYGEILLRMMLELACEFQCDSAVLEVRASNHRARRLYRKVGFIEEALLPGYYEDSKEDGFLLRKSLQLE